MAIIGITVNEADVDRPVPAMQAEPDASEWEELARRVEDGTYREACKPGDAFPLRLGKFGDFEARIAAVDADRISGSGKKAALTFLLAGPLHERRMMNPGLAQEDPDDVEKFIPGTGAVNGWMGCGLRKWLREEVLPEFPEAVRKNIVPVRKVSRTFMDNSQIYDVVTADEVWIPSRREVFGPGRFRELSGPVYGRVFSDYGSRIMTDEDGEASWWWLRSAESTTSFYNVTTSGNDSYYNATGEGGVAVGFCFGSGI